ncbi:7TM diverse intracellular signaling domain-containing protein [Sulfurovum sp. NBC37-1]|uniref:7TM diverse intracellular signaling domain-containing protein n=1 Tax=Sulfurovum sp. (strain NBC37-1) TaxID=387093 RepID=UPI0001587A0F|nr:7TM diverse intracellular signaling domain-containing protein [Sulfurovum sp. NBC37-1]BAF72980.1 hypothetical protein SUN_2038 [Sulfurovum sp. NBC37-1]
MIYNYIKSIIILFILFAGSILHADTVDLSKDTRISLLEHSSIYVANKELTIQQLLANNLFKDYREPYINLGVSQKTIWIKLELNNPTEKPIKKSMILTSPLLEHIALYTADTLDNPIEKGVNSIETQTRTTLFPYYDIHVAPHTFQTYYLKVNSSFEPVDFGIFIEESEAYFLEDSHEQFINSMLIGMVFALMLYSFFVSFYTKDRSYRYYSFYLFFLVYQQLTYIGLTQIYFPPFFVLWDIDMVVLKINLLLITSALFAMNFLKTPEIPALHRVYKLFIFLALIETIIFSIPGMYYFNTLMATGTIFIVFNLFAGIISYLRGQKQARLFIVGFGIVFVSYLLMILDAIGLTSVMQQFRNLLMFSTAFEAMILSLAFADKYTLLHTAKEKADARILLESKNRASMIEKEVIEKTRELKQAVETKELLIKEIHHRVKNNLQIILSMLRLQNDEIDNPEINDKLTNLEQRVNAIAKTYMMLLSTDNLERINMKPYIETLLLDISEAYNFRYHHISTSTDINAVLPLQKAIYIGLIINEFVTNAYKHAFIDQQGHISIRLNKEADQYVLIVGDSGQGYIHEKQKQGLGLKLIHTLIYDQLEGTLETETNEHTKYTIKFTI